MNLINILMGENALEDVISHLLNLGCFHIEEKALHGKTVPSGANPYAESLKNMEDILNYCGISYSEKAAENTVIIKNADTKLHELEIKLSKIKLKREEAKKVIAESEASISSLSHFVNLDFDIEKAIHSKYFKVRFGKITRENYSKLITFSETYSSFMFFPCSLDKQYCWGFYAVPVTEVADADRIFQSLFFERLILPDKEGEPEKLISVWKKEKEEAEKVLTETDLELDAACKSHSRDLITLYASLKRSCEIFELKKYAASYTDQKRMLSGWIPADRLGDVEKELSGIKGVKIIDAADSDGNHEITPPVKLKNKALFKPFQFFVEIYGLPGAGEVDPTAFLAITYTLLYGVMFADVGQGIILTLIALWMYKVKNMPLGKAIIPCGISGTLFGFVFGSVFGYEDVLNPMYKALGFSEKPFPVMDNAVNLLLFSVGIGIVLIIAALILGVVSNFKKKNLGEAVFGANGIAGLIMYLSVLTLIGGMLLDIKLPTLPIVIIGIIIPVISIFLKKPLGELISGAGFKVENPGDFILENFFELFEVLLGFFTNTISFLRVGAFVLIHAGMMMAFTALAEMVGGGIAGIIMMIFGNAFVIALEGLLVGIQVLRLEFYEMFSRFYDGNGRPFSPIKLNKKRG